MNKPAAAGLLAGQRALVTNSEAYMGPAVCERFAEEGASVVADPAPTHGSSSEVERIVRQAAEIDILVINQSALSSRHSPTAEIGDGDWLAFFDYLVHPTMWFVRAVLPQMIARRAGKIVAVTSAAPLYGAPESAGYTAARSAQNGFLKTVGHEVAEYNVQVNAIAQNVTKNPTFWPPEVIALPEVQRMLREDVPAKRFAESWESADLAVFLASQRSNFICGEIIPFAGGWITFSRDQDGSPFGRHFSEAPGAARPSERT
jgi:2-keto-3-deoxy-L-fuconate dehydrogenase